MAGSASPTANSASKDSAQPTFLEYVAAAKRTGDTWYERVKDKESIDTWHDGAKKDPQYALAIFTVYLCIEYGIISLEDDMVFQGVDIFDLKTWDGKKDVYFTSLLNVSLTVCDLEVWELWGKPMPSEYELPRGGIPCLEDYVLEAWIPLKFEVTYKRDNPLETQVYLKLRDMLEQAQSSSAKVNFKFLFGKHTNLIKRRCERSPGSVKTLTCVSAADQDQDDSDQGDSVQGDLEVKEYIRMVGEFLDRKSKSRETSVQSEAAAIRDHLENLSEHLGGSDDIEVLGVRRKRKAVTKACSQTKRSR